MNNDEYIGGLSDFTGEIGYLLLHGIHTYIHTHISFYVHECLHVCMTGRMALALASKRDIEGTAVCVQLFIIQQQS